VFKNREQEFKKNLNFTLAFYVNGA